MARSCRSIECSGNIELWGKYMAKKPVKPFRRTVADKDDAFPGAAANLIRGTISELQLRSITAQAPFTFHAEDFMKAHFPISVLHAAERAYEVCHPNLLSWTNYCSGYDAEFGCHVHIRDWHALRMFPISQNMIIMPHDGIFYKGRELMLQEVERIRDEWAMVRAVFDWLNKHATAEAIYALWKPIVYLIPLAYRDALAPKTNRYETPDNFGPISPYIRSTATTIASALLAPEIDTVSKVSMQLEFGERVTSIMNGHTSKVPALIYEDRHHIVL